MSYKIYGKMGCPSCVSAVELLESKDIAFEYIDVMKNHEALSFIKSQGAKTVPQVYLGEKLIGGYEDLYNYLQIV